jgi:ribonucleoside-diphosphate reductase alpha chain
MALQHGVPVESLISKYIDHRFEPSGMTSNPRIPMARSIVDYVAKWMASRFLSEEDQRLAGVLTDSYRAELTGGGDDRPREGAAPAGRDAAPADAPEADLDDQLTLMTPAVERATNGNGNGSHTPERPRLVLTASGEVCHNCGSSDLVRAGTCLTCRSCGSTTGCG